MPFAALTRFADPGVKFGMQFEFKSTSGPGKLQLVGGVDEALAEAEEDGSLADDMTEIGANRDAANVPAAAPKTVEADDDKMAEPSEDGSGDAENSRETAQDESESNDAGAEVVTLDSFRKK